MKTYYYSMIASGTTESLEKLIMSDLVGTFLFFSNDYYTIFNDPFVNENRSAAIGNISNSILLASFDIDDFITTISISAPSKKEAEKALALLEDAILECEGIFSVDIDLIDTAEDE